MNFHAYYITPECNIGFSLFLDIINYTREYFRQVIGIQGVFVNWKTHIGKFELMTKITDSKIIGSFKRGCVAPAEVNPYEVFKTYKKRIYFLYMLDIFL